MNIYVGNLNWNMTSEDLYELFAPYGEVTSAKIVLDKYNNNRSKGFGFVEMPDDESARQAINELNDVDIQSRKIVVNESTPRTDGDRRDFSSGDGGGGGGYKKKPYNPDGGGYRGGSGNGGGGGYQKGGGGGYGKDRNPNKGPRY